ncbi:hypothetical protein [Streptomyces sp. DASNCL29]|uniref:hypothetical protein n=1 Tax=Streptomyces sp. DASNCL29 TaxID=2583819 RepID=UPI00110F7A55|nr:hypothetical protein [Streptomyces sp. DASNCL29]TMU96498.1 hypothetical protein FGK60_00185 [Streptomyces sp. DASNCL29]
MTAFTDAEPGGSSRASLDAVFEGHSRHFLPGKTGPRVPLRQFVMLAPAASLPIPVLSETLDTSITAAFQWTRRLLAAGTPTYGESCG